MIHTDNNNFSVLPFYTDIQLQNHRRSYAYGNIYPLFAPANLLLPFQIMRATREVTDITVMLYEKDGTFVRDISLNMAESGLTTKRFTAYGVDLIIYPAEIPMPLVQFDGQYYITLSDGVQTWYSEIFTAVQDMSAYLKIEWWDEENLFFDAGIISYNEPRFRNKVYLCTELGKPDYEFEEEGETRDGYFFVQKQISEKRYKFTFLSSEYLLDVMRFVRMADHVRITDKYGRIYECDTFLITPKWQTQGDLASVEAEFDTATVVKKTGLGYIQRAAEGDYNEDYNEDYNN